MRFDEQQPSTREWIIGVIWSLFSTSEAMNVSCRAREGNCFIEALSNDGSKLKHHKSCAFSWRLTIGKADRLTNKSTNRTMLRQLLFAINARSAIWLLVSSRSCSERAAERFFDFCPPRVRELSRKKKLCCRKCPELLTPPLSPPSLGRPFWAALKKNRVNSVGFHKRQIHLIILRDVIEI